MAIRISSVASSKISDDGKEVIVASTGKYTGDLELRFARECLDQLIDLLEQAREVLKPSGEPAPAAVASVPAVPSAVDGAAIPPAPLPAEPAAAPPANPDEVRFEIPKNFTVTADTSGRGLVLMIVNHRLERQIGYAFAPDAAKQIAGGLIKSAEAVLAMKKSATPRAAPPT